MRALGSPSSLRKYRRTGLSVLDSPAIQSTIDACAAGLNFRQALGLLRQIDRNPQSLTRRIAGFLKDRKLHELLDIADAMPRLPEMMAVIAELKKRNYYIGIITEYYQVVADHLARQIDADFSLGIELHAAAGTLTGTVTIPSFFYYAESSTCNHLVCKTNALRYICHQYKVPVEQCIIVAHEESDTCMLQQTQKGVSLNSESESLRKAACLQVETHSLQDIFRIA